jgi:hypothetical protein
MRARSLVVVGLVGAVGLAACNSILGIDDHQLATDSGAGSGSGSDTGTSSGDDSASSSGSDSSSGGEAGAGDCSSWAGAECGYINQCNPGTFQENYASMTDCVTRLGADCLLAQAAPGSGETSAKLAQCAGFLQTLQCGWGIAQPGGKCDFHGTGAPGTSCYFNQQCLSFQCNRADGTACGTCTSEAAMGAACDGTVTTCPQNGTCSNGKCIPYVGLNATCDTTNACANGLDCVLPSAGATSGTCQLLGTSVGTTCNAQAVGSPRCASGNGVHCSAGSCAANTFVAVGSPCGTNSTFCIDSFCANGTCAAALAIGSACPVGGFPRCALDSVCVGSSEAGAPEAGSGEGGSDASIVGTCKPYAVCK